MNISDKGRDRRKHPLDMQRMDDDDYDDSPARSMQMLSGLIVLLLLAVGSIGLYFAN